MGTCVCACACACVYTCVCVCVYVCMCIGKSNLLNRHSFSDKIMVFFVLIDSRTPQSDQLNLPLENHELLTGQSTVMLEVVD